MFSTSAGDGSAGSFGGPAILIEEKTATWCGPCAEFDPHLAEFIVDAGGRAVLASHHPDDGQDPLGSPASAHRLSRLGASSSTVTPTLWFDGGEGVSGPLTRNDLSRQISSAEGRRSISSRLTIIPAAMTLETAGVTVILDAAAMDVSNTSLTVMLVETSVVRPAGGIEGDPLWTVTRGVAEIDLQTDSFVTELPADYWSVKGDAATALDLKIALDPSWQLDSLGWIVVHERVAGGEVVEVFGAHALLPDGGFDEDLSPRWMIGAGILLMAVGARIWRSKSGAQEGV